MSSRSSIPTRAPISKEEALKELGFNTDNKPKLHTLVKKIDSPLAKYTSTGKLLCALCNVPVKSEIVWKAHINGKMHRETVMMMKSEKSKPGDMKRKAEDMIRDLKKIKALEEKKKAEKQKEIEKQKEAQKRSESKNKSESSSQKNQVQKSVQNTQKSSKSHHPEKRKKLSKKEVKKEKRQKYAALMKQKYEKEKQGTFLFRKSDKMKRYNKKHGLPNDFFDNPPAAKDKEVTNIVEEEKSSDEEIKDSDSVSANSESKVTPGNVTSSEASTSKTETLPEGFFDDPKLDAKARNVEYKDAKEEEWKSFLRSIEAEESVSAAIQDEDQDVSTAERHIDEIDEQIKHWERVLDMEKKKEILASKSNKEGDNEDMNEDSSSADEAEVDEFLDWRAKGAY